MTDNHFSKTFSDPGVVLFKLEPLLPDPQDPTFVVNFVRMTEQMAYYLLNEIHHLEGKVPYEELVEAMALSRLLKLNDDSSTPDELKEAIQAYVSCLARTSWDEIITSGIPSITWMNHNFCYVSLLELAKQ